MESKEEFLERRKKDLSSGERELPNGCTLYWKVGDMGREYFSDEIGGGVIVWLPALVDASTLLAALEQEATCKYTERQRNALHTKE